MTFAEFDESRSQNTAPSNISPILKALWLDAKGDWEAAHDVAQSQEGEQSFDRLHAYLHRKEGDKLNADYWYRRAKTSTPSLSLEEEWHLMVIEELNK